MKTTQEELKDRGYQTIKCTLPECGENDISICRLPLVYENPDTVAHIKYSEIIQRNTAQEKLDFILSKLPHVE